MTYGAQRLVGLDGQPLTSEALSHAEAKAEHRQLTKHGVTNFWQAWCGERTGWNSVAAWWNKADALLGLVPSEPKRPVGRPRKINTALLAEVEVEIEKAKEKVDSG